MTTAFRDTLASTYIITGLAQAFQGIVNGIYESDRVWDTAILDTAAQNDSGTFWSGPEIDNASRFFFYNASGWTVGLSLNGNGNVSVPPNSLVLVSLAGSLSTIQNLDDPLTYVDWELTSASGSPGKLYAMMAGVLT
jgi:hypothetical protein